MFLEKIKSIVIITFVLGCFYVIYLAVSLQIGQSLLNQKNTKAKGNDSDNESYFTLVDYFIVKDSNPKLYLKSSELSINGLSKRTVMFGPNGKTFNSDGSEILYKSDRGIFDQQKNNLLLEKRVEVNTKGITINSNRLFYKINIDEVEATGNVKTKSYSEKTKDTIYIDSDKVVAWPIKHMSHYSTNVKGRVHRKRVYEESIYFDSHDLKLDMNEMKVELEGDVSIRKQRVKARSHRGEIFLENYNKKLKYYVLYDDVKVTERVIIKEGSSFVRKAFAEKLEGIVSEDRIELTGYPKVFQQGDVIKGNKIVLRENNEVIEVDDANTNFILK